MSAVIAPRTLLWPLLVFAAAASACSGRGALRTGGSTDADPDLPTEMRVVSDGSASTDGTADSVDMPISNCGNGWVDPGEQCDDGNTVSGDGCSRLCQIESDWPPGCPTPSCRLVVCGDGVLASSEACDDGNITSGDGCSGNCQTVEEGWRCPWIGHRCIPICGDRLLEGSETCDDGNTLSGDGCSTTCLTEPGWDCTRGTCVLGSAVDGGQPIDGGALYCGDGIISGAEECDDGALNSDSAYGGCSTQCMSVHCGDGIVNGPEECDLGPGNTATYGDTGGCTPGCTRAHYCGDGIVDIPRENCDLGSANGVLGSGCGLDCLIPGVY